MTDGTSGDHAVQLSWCVNEQRAELEGAPKCFSLCNKLRNERKCVKLHVLTYQLRAAFICRELQSGCRISTVPAAACASPRLLCCFLAAWHRLPGPPMETSRTPFPIGCQCLSLDQIAGSQSRTAAGGKRGRSQWQHCHALISLCLSLDFWVFKPKLAAKLHDNLSLFCIYTETHMQTAPAHPRPLPHVFTPSPSRFFRNRIQCETHKHTTHSSPGQVCVHGNGVLKSLQGDLLKHQLFPLL